MIKKIVIKDVAANKKNTFVSSLKWICWILIGLIGLIVTVKLCLHR